MLGSVTEITKKEVIPLKFWKKVKVCIFKIKNGAEGDRTLGLLNAIQARSQLRHSPILIMNYNIVRVIRQII